MNGSSLAAISCRVETHAGRLLVTQGPYPSGPSTTTDTYDHARHTNALDVAVRGEFVCIDAGRAPPRVLVGAHSAVLFATSVAARGRFFACRVEDDWSRFRIYRFVSAEDYFELKVFRRTKKRAIAAPAALQLPEIQRAVWKLLFRAF